MGSSKTDQEARLEAVFAGLEADFKRLDKARDPDKAQALLKDVTTRLKDAKACVLAIAAVRADELTYCLRTHKLHKPHTTLLLKLLPSTSARFNRLIQEFEREARTDGMPTRELADRKRRLVNTFNTYVNLKKQHSSTEAGRGELLAGAATAAGGQQGEAAGGGSATDGTPQSSSSAAAAGCFGSA